MNCDKVVLGSRAQCLLDSLIRELGIENYTLSITQGTSRGDNYLGMIAKVHVKTDSASWYWIIKCAPEANQFRVFVPVTKVYTREVYFYERILTEYQKLQEEKGVTAQFRSYPKYYASFLEEPYETIIMEDLKAVGYKLHNRQVPLDYDHAVMVMREYGRFHALSFAIRDQKPELFQEFQRNLPEVLYEILSDEGSKKVARNQCGRALESMDKASNKGAYEKFANFQRHMFELAEKVVELEAAGRYAVVSHGDCWINNLLFQYSQSQNSPTGLCFIDWQMSRVGSPVLDLSYFLFTTTDKQLRDRHFDDLIKEYHRSLSSFLIELGSDPEELYPFHVLQEHLKKFSVYGLFMAIQILNLMFSDENEIPDVHNFTSEEDAMEQMQYVPKNIDRYNTRITEIVLDFDKLGYDFSL